jgi:hypothetical protein
MGHVPNMMPLKRGRELFQELSPGSACWHATPRPSPHTRLPPSPSGYQPLFPSSRLLSSFLNLSSSTPYLNSALQHLTSNLPYNTSSLHSPSFLLLHTPCCTQDQLIYFVFLSFHLWLLVLMVLCVFFCLVVSIQVFAQLLIVANYFFNSIICC